MKVLQHIFSRKPVHPHSDQVVVDSLARSPHFSVEVQLSDAARKKLIDDEETIIVLASFTGSPKEGAESRFLSKARQVRLGEIEREIRPGEITTFEQMNLNPDALAQVDSQGPVVFIEASSGRQSSKNNLLDCDDYEGGFASVLGTTVVLHGRLIDERFPAIRSQNIDFRGS